MIKLKEYGVDGLNPQYNRHYIISDRYGDYIIIEKIDDEYGEVIGHAVSFEKGIELIDMHDMI